MHTKGREVTARRVRRTVALGACLVVLALGADGAAAGLRGGQRSLTFGLSAGSEGTLAVLGLGYHLNPYFELGATGAVAMGGDAADTAQVGPYLKVYPLPRPPIAPFLHLAAQRLFVEGTADGTVLHAGVGVMLFVGRHLRLSGEVYREEVSLPGLGTERYTDYHIGAGFVF